MLQAADESVLELLAPSRADAVAWARVFQYRVDASAYGATYAHMSRLTSSSSISPLPSVSYRSKAKMVRADFPMVQ